MLSNMATTTSIKAGRHISSSKGIETPGQAVPARQDRRGRSRVQCEGLTCTLGRVIGLSGSGMRIRASGWCRIRQDDRLVITLAHMGGKLSLKVRIAWVRKVGLFQYESGMAFEELTPQQNTELGRIAQMTMPKLTMRKGTLPDLPTD